MKSVLLTIVYLTLAIALHPISAVGQVAFDVSLDDLKSRTNSIDLSDLSVNDTAYIYPTFCLLDANLHLPSNTRPSNLAEWTTDATGIIFQVTMLPSRRVSLRVVEAARAQRLARGDVAAGQTMTSEEMLQDVTERFERFLRHDHFIGRAGQLCEQLSESAPLTEITFLQVRDIDGHQSIRSLLGFSE